MTRCLIEGCLHTISRRSRIGFETNSWGLYGICPCCYNELFWCDVKLPNPITPKIIQNTTRCNDKIKTELTEPDKPNFARVIEIQKKKKWKAKKFQNEMLFH